jgi:N-acetyl-gamma-glutamyl-phosphate reductase
MESINVGIIGGAGYTGGELVRLLLNHDRVQIAFVQSRSQAGKLLSDVHTDLRGQTDLKFTATPDLSHPALSALFLALPHGEAKRYLLEKNIPETTRIIDLSNDFRLAHDAKVGNREFIYGLPELRRETIRSAKSIANPGCFASAIQFALLPLAKEKLLKPVHVTGITGSTGAGQKPSETTHFSFRANNIQAYKTLAHQHIAEIEESLSFLQGSSAQGTVSFIPWRGDFTRGIFISAQIDCSLNQSEALSLFKSYYEGHPFISVTDQAIDLKSVVNTNRVQIEVTKVGHQLAVHVAIDNLLKGASGQAVQNFNLMLGLPETQGLNLKGSAF